MMPQKFTSNAIKIIEQMIGDDEELSGLSKKSD